MFNYLPSLDEIKNLMKKVANEHGIPEQVDETWDHETGVWNFADKIAKLAIKNGYKVDLNLLKIACFIHDFGRMITGGKASKILEDPIYHGMRGYKLAKEQGWPEKIARICCRHMGGIGQTKEVNQQIKFVDYDTLAETIEEKILAYSDSRSFFNKKLGHADIESFEKAYNRFKIYPRAGELLLKNKNFIDKITGGKLS